MMRIWKAGICAAAVCLMASCSPAANDAAPAETAAPLTAADSPMQLTPAEDSEPMQWAASVIRVNDLTNEANSGVKLYGTAGGDPAMNGLYTYIAFYQSPAEGWRIFMIGDFLDYRILAETPGRVDLELHESMMNDATGEIGSITRHVIVSWTPGAEGAAPATVDVTPAEQAS